MNKNLLIIGIAVLLIVVGLSGCNENGDSSNNGLTDEEKKFIGTWEGTSVFLSDDPEVNITINVTYIFESNGNCVVESNSVEILNGNWEIINDNLAITANDDTKTGSYQFSNDYHALLIIDSRGNAINLIKQ